MSRRVLPSVAVSLACLVVGRTAAPAQRAAEQPPVITAFAINAGSDSVSISEPAVALTHSVVGTRPSEYRVSHRADFAGARWEPYSASISLREWYDGAGPSCDASRPSHRVTFFLQVRATLGEEIRIVDGQRQLMPARVESNVLRATVCARAAPKSSDDREFEGGIHLTTSTAEDTQYPSSLGA